MWVRHRSCFSSIHDVLLTLLLSGIELLPETSGFSNNAIPNPHTRTRIKDTCLRNLYLRLLLDVSLISTYLSTLRKQKGVTFLVCDRVIATSRFAQKYYILGRLRRLVPPKNGLIALLLTTNGVMCSKCVSQTRNEAIDNCQWYIMLLNFILSIAITLYSKSP